MFTHEVIYIYIYINIYIKFRSLRSVWMLLIAENWKHYSEIIFKCMNGAVWPSFKEKFTEFRTYKSREQCMGLTEMKCKRTTSEEKRYPNSHLFILNKASRYLALVNVLWLRCKLLLTYEKKIQKIKSVP